MARQHRFSILLEYLCCGVWTTRFQELLEPLDRLARVNFKAAGFDISWKSVTSLKTIPLTACAEAS